MDSLLFVDFKVGKFTFKFALGLLIRGFGPGLFVTTLDVKSFK